MTVQPTLPTPGLAPAGASTRSGDAPTSGTGSFMALLSALISSDPNAAATSLGTLPGAPPLEEGTAEVTDTDAGALALQSLALGLPIEVPPAGVPKTTVPTIGGSLEGAPTGSALIEASATADSALTGSLTSPLSGGAAGALVGPPVAGSTPVPVPAASPSAPVAPNTSASAPLSAAVDGATVDGAGTPDQGGDTNPDHAGSPAARSPLAESVDQVDVNTSGPPTDDSIPAATTSTPLVPARGTEALTATLSPSPGAANSAVAAAAINPATQVVALQAPVATTPAPVVSQVFDQVVRMNAAEGGQTKRVTLLLQPAHMGEVRITLVTRQDQLHVSLAAGDDTTRTLLAGTSELRRLLESVGATDARITIREPSGSDNPSRSETRADAGNGRPGETPTDAQGQSRTVWSRHAPESATPATGSSTTKVRSAAAGLDVTM